MRLSSPHAVVMAPCDTGAPGQNHWDIWHTPAQHQATSMYCVSVMLPHSYEQDIFSSLLYHGRSMKEYPGLFACDDFDLFSRYSVRVGWHHRRGWVHSNAFTQAPTLPAMRGHVYNSELFVNLWNAVRHRRSHLSHDWTVKLDPDAVMIPDRLRSHLAPHTGQVSFVQNCAPVTWTSSFMFGSVEAITKAALQRFLVKQGVCKGGLAWKSEGEDFFMDSCLRKVGAVPVLEMNMLGDQSCHPYVVPDCYANLAVYHFYKSVPSWWSCWYRASSR